MWFIMFAVTQINPAKPHGGGGSGGKPGGANCAPQQQPSPTQGHHQFSSFQQNVSATTQFVSTLIQALFLLCICI